MTTDPRKEAQKVIDAKKTESELEFVLRCLISCGDNSGKVNYGDIAAHLRIRRLAKDP